MTKHATSEPLFELDPRLQRDCIELGRLELSRLLLMNDRTYPWFILVPERHGILEIHQLTEPDQQLLLRESSRLAEAMLLMFQPDKLNIAAIGNIVSQLHIHHIARSRTDPAWPGVVWGRERGPEWPVDELARIRVGMGHHLACCLQ